MSLSSVFTTVVVCSWGFCSTRDLVGGTALLFVFVECAVLCEFDTAPVFAVTGVDGDATGILEIDVVDTFPLGDLFDAGSLVGGAVTWVDAGTRVLSGLLEK